MKPAPMPATYDGREQAYVKHSLLKAYLQALLMIMGLSGGAKGREVELCFVDCFAGPWQSPDDDLSGTSIALSLEILSNFKSELAKMGVSTRMRALYVEKDRTAFGRLKTFIERQRGGPVEAECFEGDFLDLRGAILDWCGPKPFCFFFIDPKGFKEIGVTQLAPLLERKRSEFLINFMYMFVNRAASIDELKTIMIELLGAEIDLRGLRPDEREDYLLSCYRAGLVAKVSGTSTNYPPRSAYARVLDSKKERVKYHLVYVTSHPKGIVEFMEASESAERIQRTVREHVHFQSREQSQGMGDLFADEVRAPEAAARAAGKEIDLFWLRYLENGSRTIGLDDFASILEETDYFPGELQASLRGLIDAELIVNDAEKRRRGSKPLHYEKNETLRLTPDGLIALRAGA
jgi:three-Cys-motif partner protein